VPAVVTVIRNTARRTWTFVRGAGPIILVFTMALWALLTFPRTDAAAGADETRARATQIESSYMGRAGKFIEPAIQPLGFDWKIGIGILGSFAARELFVPTLGVIYAVEGTDDAAEAAENEGLLASVRGDKWPDGRPVYTPLVGISLLVFYVIALQCMSTLATLKRETNSWRWPVGLFVAYTAIAYVASLLVFQVGTALGF
jgi:ferrous iron transport protein B